MAAKPGGALEDVAGTRSCLSVIIAGGLILIGFLFHHFARADGWASALGTALMWLGGISLTLTFFTFAKEIWEGPDRELKRKFEGEVSYSCPHCGFWLGSDFISDFIKDTTIKCPECGGTVQVN